MTNDPPLIGITLGDPVGIGPEIIVKAFSDPGLFQTARPLVLGDIKVLSRARDMLAPSLAIHPIDTPAQGKFSPGTIDIIPLSESEASGSTISRIRNGGFPASSTSSAWNHRDSPPR